MAKRPRRSYSYYSRTKPPKKILARRALVVLLLLGLAAVLLLGVYAGLRYAGSLFFSRNPKFELKTIDIATDGRLTPSQLCEYANLKPGVNLFTIDFAALRKKLEEVPLVESVAIERKLPDTLSIRVIERVAMAQIRWSLHGLPFLIDRHGVVLPMMRNGQSLPLIEGLKLEKNLRPGNQVDTPGVRQCLDLLAACDELGLGAQVAFGAFDLRYPDFVNVTVNGETSVRFPHHSAREKLVRLVSVLQLSNEQGQRIRTVDLTPDGRNVPVTYY
jgi:cell division protein FtsQ